MSEDAIGRGCLVHYNDQHIQVRKDFLDICAYDKSQYNTEKRKSGKTKRDEPNQECMAKILRLLETLTNRKKEQWYLKNEALRIKGRQPLKEPTEYRIEMAYATIVRLLYNTFGESIVRNSIAVLRQKGFIKQYQEKKNSIPTYALNIPVVQQVLQQQAQETEEDESEVLHATSEEKQPAQVLKVQAQGVNVTPEVLKVQAEVLNATSNNITNNKDNKINHKIGDNANVPAPTKPSLTPSGKHILDLYQHYKKRKVTLTNSTVAAANGLSEVVEQDQDLLDVLGEMEQDDFIRKRDVRIDLDFVHRKYDGYFDVVCRKRTGPLHKSKPAGGQPTVVAAAAKQQERAEALLKRAAIL